MSTSVLDYPYEMRDVIINKKNISLIDIVNQRQIRNTQVNSILRALNKNCHFDSLFVVNIINHTKRIRVIDGGHRVEALKRYFEKNTDKDVKVSLAAYRDLTPVEEREVYTKWNIGLKQTIDDFINAYKDEISVFESMIDDLPISVYGYKNKLKLRYMADAYLSSKQNPFTGGCHYSRDGWLKALRELTNEDVESMKETFSIIKKIFNPNDIVDFTRLPAFKFTAFKAIYRLVHVNRTFLGKNYVIKRMTKVLYNSALLEQFKGAQKQGCIDAELMFKQMLNSKMEHKFR